MKIQEIGKHTRTYQDKGYLKMSKRKAFITGINGFIGANLAKHLCAQGANVFGLVRNEDKQTLLYYENIYRFFKI